MIGSVRGFHVVVGLAATVLGAALLAPIELRAQSSRMRCSIATSGGMAFGSYDFLSATPLDGAALITLECSSVGPADQVQIEVGRGNERAFARRAMRHGRHRLEYNLYTDAARSVIWGDGSGGSGVFRARPPDGAPLVVPIFGRVPARQNVAPGAYSDDIAVVVVY